MAILSMNSRNMYVLALQLSTNFHPKMILLLYQSGGMKTNSFTVSKIGVIFKVFEALDFSATMVSVTRDFVPQ